MCSPIFILSVYFDQTIRFLHYVLPRKYYLRDLLSMNKTNGMYQVTNLAKLLDESLSQLRQFSQRGMILMRVKPQLLQLQIWLQDPPQVMIVNGVQGHLMVSFWIRIGHQIDREPIWGPPPCSSQNEELPVLLPQCQCLLRI